MARTAALVVALVAAVLCVSAPFFAESTEKTLNGTYNWNNGAAGDLQAVFKPTGEGKWDVDFHFKFQGEPHTYSGTAEGTLGAGTLQGKVQNEGKKRTFTFQGSFEDGKFTGKHAELRGSDPQPTGTLTLGS